VLVAQLGVGLAHLCMTLSARAAPPAQLATAQELPCAGAWAGVEMGLGGERGGQGETPRSLLRSSLCSHPPKFIFANPRATPKPQHKYKINDS